VVTIWYPEGEYFFKSDSTVALLDWAPESDTKNVDTTAMAIAITTILFTAPSM
jgi:hypothetical protein